MADPFRLFRIPLTAFFLSVATATWAGPPFVTDDPAPVDLGHWEVYGFSSAVRTKSETGGTLTGFDVNYGAVKNLHVHLLASLAFNSPSGGSTRTGIGDVEFGAKYRILNPGPNEWLPQVAIYPAVMLPTGDESRGLGDGHVRAFLPVWFQKDFGPWTTYGGAGYDINPGAGNRNYGFFGWVLQRRITEQFALGGELTHFTPDTRGGDAASGFNLGGTYDLTAHYHLLASGGRGLQNTTSTNELQYYLGIQWTN